MSGLLRRIKRSRAADAGEAPGEGQAAATEDARKTTEHSAGAARADQPAPPAIRADPNVPAGVDPAEAAVQPPKGRRGRLRRRLRYLRRARELMLRDLGGLLYEVHRTGGGDLSAHGTVIGGKVQRLAGLDAEAAAIESALASPRGETVVFQPGVGGTCESCGELYGSAARYCSNCGTPTGAAGVGPPAAGAELERRVPPMPKAPAAAAADAPTRLDTPAEAPTNAPAPSADEPTTDQPAAASAENPPSDASTDPADAPTATNAAPADASTDPADAPTATNAAADASTDPPDAPAATNAPADDAASGPPRRRNPFTALRNGRARDNAEQGLFEGDELARESRS